MLPVARVRPSTSAFGGADDPAPDGSSVSMLAARPLASSAAVDTQPALPSSAGSFDGVVSTSQLNDEAEMIQRAQAHLRRGELAQAFAVLETSRTRFPTAALAQEREVLDIELLRRSGQRAAALERARMFLQRFPDSPLGPELRAFLDSP